MVGLFTIAVGRRTRSSEGRHSTGIFGRRPTWQLQRHGTTKPDKRTSKTQEIYGSCRITNVLQGCLTMFRRLFVGGAVVLISLFLGMTPINAKTLRVPTNTIHVSDQAIHVSGNAVAAAPNATDSCTVQSNINALYGKYEMNALYYSGTASCSETTSITVQANLQYCPPTANCPQIRRTSWITEDPQPAVGSVGTSFTTPTYPYSTPDYGSWRNLIKWTLIGPTGSAASGVVYSNIIFNPYTYVVHTPLLTMGRTN